MVSFRKYSAFSKLILRKFFNINVDERAVELSQMKAKQDEDQVKIRELTDTVSAREQQIEGLTQELDTSRRNLASVQKEKQRSEENCDRLKFNLKKANSAIDKLQDEQKKLQNQVNDYKSVIRDLDTSLGRRAEELEKCYATIDTLKNNLADSELHLREATCKLEGKQQETNQLQAQKAELEKLLSEQKDAAGSQNEMIQNQQTQINSFTQDLTSKDSIIQSLNTKLTEVGAQLKEAIKESEKWQEETSKIQTAKSELENQLSELKEELQALQTDFDRSKETSSWLESTLKQKEEEQANAKSSIESLTEEVEKLKAQLEGKQSYIDRAIKFREELTKSNAKLEGEKANLKHQADTQKEIIDEQQAEIDALKKEKDDLQAQLETCQGEVDKLRQEQTPQAIMDKYQSEITRLNNLVQSLENNIQSRDNIIDGLKSQLTDSENRLSEAIQENEALNQQVSELVSPQQDDDDTSKEIRELTKKLEERDSIIQELNEKLAGFAAAEREYQGKFAALEQSLIAKIDALTKLLREKDITIHQKDAKIKELETALAAYVNKEQQIDEKTQVPVPSQEKPEQPYYPLAKVLPAADEDVVPSDLPTIVEDGTVVTTRSIEAVINWETGEHIKANEFFGRPKEEIAKISRRLEIISKTGDDPLFVCEKCCQPVKISKISTKKGESLFFSHCHNDVPCEWRKEGQTPSSPIIDLDDATIETARVEKSRYSHLRDVIYDALKEQQEKGFEINALKSNKRIKGETSRVWRNFDVYVRWHNIDIVFKLQRSIDYLQDIVGIDEFCKQNKLFIIWVFGSDSATSYDYLLQSTYQNTLFDNRSCVFIMDDEAERACKEAKDLRLKCNWLVDGKHWFYTNANTGSNGILVSLNDLNYDDTNTYKPYYRKMGPKPTLDSEDLIGLKPGIFKYRQGSLWGIYNQEKDIKSQCKYSDISLDKKGSIVAVTSDYLHPRVGILSDIGEEIPTTYTKLATDVYRLNIFELFCLAHKKDGEPFTEMFESIEKWGNDRLVIKTQSGYGAMDYKGNIIITPKYIEFVIDNNWTAKVTDYSGTYLINHIGIAIPDETIELSGKIRKVRHLDRWGMYDNSGTLFIKYSYLEIGSFRKRFYGITENGLFKLQKAPRYDYRIPFRAVFKGMSSNGDYVFDCHGIEMIMPDNKYNHAERFVGTEYDVYLLNIIKEDDKEFYIIAAADDKTNEMKFDQVDSDSDFKKGEKLTGKVTRIKNGKRLYIRFPDGRQTYISKSRIKRFGFDPKQYGEKSLITLEKIDFDPYYESTKWKVIK